jgi:CheY-like chemotaxis protein
MARILIVDDVEDVRLSLRGLLEAAGHEVDEATNGREALEVTARESFDLVLADIFMPERDGLSFLDELRRRDAEVPVIIMSGGGPGAPLERAVALADAYGASRVLFKPFENTELLQALDELLARRAP